MSPRESTPPPRARRGPQAVVAADVRPYAPPRSRGPITLDLAQNMGPQRADLAAAPLPASAFSAYPPPRPLEERLAMRLGVEPEQVLVTAGADEALDRLCRAYLAPGRELILPVPTFEMLPRYARLAGATLRELPWPGGPYPRDAVLAAVGEATGMIAVVTPNNPTGAVASAADLRALSQAAPQALLLVDLAYTEFAEVDLTSVALELPNAVLTRTFSKAWGLAGLRVGYAVGPAELIAPLRATGSPFPVAGLSLVAAERALAEPQATAGYLARVRHERQQLAALARELGFQAGAGQANFVLINLAGSGHTPDSLSAALAGQGIAIRNFRGRRHLEDCVRISCPGDPVSFTRLEAALRAAVAGTAPAANAAVSAAPASPQQLPGPRRGRVERATKETRIAAQVTLDGDGQSQIDTGIPFLDHLLDALTRHSRLDVSLTCAGDLEVDDHHSAEDCALSLGAAIDQALGDRRGIRRFGHAHAPLDEALARAVIDFSGRPHAEIRLGLTREQLGGLACENVGHVLHSLAVAARATLHVTVLEGENDHHKAEAAFKATALALRQAVGRDGAHMPSTKGVL